MTVYLGDRKYYKYTYSTFNQPVLTANGDIGGESFAVTAVNTDTRTQPYYAFDSNKANTYTAGWLSKASDNYLEWYNPNPINITKLVIQYQTSAEASVGYISSWKIAASNDDVNYTDILTGTTGNYGVTTIDIQHTGYYKYWRFYPLAWSSEWYAIIDLQITAQEQSGYVESTEGDYDFFKNVKIKDLGTHGVYIGSQNTNCLTYVPKNIKLGLDSLGVNVVGSPTISNGVVSGFSSANYVYITKALPFASASAIEIVVRAKSNSLSGGQVIVGNTSDQAAQGGLIVRTAGGSRLYCWATNNNSNWPISQFDTGLDLTTDFMYIKISYTPTNLSFAISSDNSTWTNGKSTSISGVTDLNARLGLSGTVYQLNGSIDLSQSYINVNGSRWWTGGTGTLTLKAGSKVYVPNGFESDGTTPKFDEVVVAGDLINQNFNNSGTTFIRYENGLLFCDWTVSNFSSGSDSSSVTGWYYDTSKNELKYYNNGVANNHTVSLPLGIATISNTVVTSINQVFDWCGFIGSTAFVLPGVKELIPNGFKANGTYKSIEYTVPDVITFTQSAHNDVNSVLIGDTKESDSYLNQSNFLGNYSSDNIPAAKGSWGSYYNTTENQFYLNHDSAWYKTNRLKCADIAVMDGKITSLTPATVQPAAGAISINAIYNGSQLVYQYVPPATTFQPSTGFQTYVVPRGVTKLNVDCVAAKGYSGGVGGKGGRVQCILAVTPGQTLYVYASVDPNTQSSYTYNASDIRTNNAGLTDTTSLQSRLIVAGGGGYGSRNASYYASGGAGGGLTGANGDNAYAYGGAGGGGTQTAGGGGGSTGGGLPGWNGGTGQFGLGGISNDWTQSGGSGWYGGGGGGAGAYYGDGRGGGGGGSSYTHPSLCTNVVHTQGYQNGAGYVTITPMNG